MARKPIALHIVSDWAVRPGVTLATFADGSHVGLFDSFKPAAGYSIYWVALMPVLANAWLHVDVRELLPGSEPALNRAPIEPASKVAAIRDLLQHHFPSCEALLACAQPIAVTADASNNELARRRPA